MTSKVPPKTSTSNQNWDLELHATVPWWYWVLASVPSLVVVYYQMDEFISMLKLKCNVLSSSYATDNDLDNLNNYCDQKDNGSLVAMWVVNKRLWSEMTIPLHGLATKQKTFMFYLWDQSHKILLFLRLVNLSTSLYFLSYTVS